MKHIITFVGTLVILNMVTVYLGIGSVSSILASFGF